VLVKETPSSRRFGPEGEHPGMWRDDRWVALANGLPLYTRNPDDFAGIDGLVVVAVKHPNRALAAGEPRVLRSRG
jgi:hypothetical protein